MPPDKVLSPSSTTMLLFTKATAPCTTPLLATPSCYQWTDLEEPFCSFQFGCPTAECSVRPSACIFERPLLPVLGQTPNFPGRSALFALSLFILLELWSCRDMRSGSVGEGLGWGIWSCEFHNHGRKS